MNIQELMDESSETAIAHGFRDDPGKSFGDDIALIHSELSEALDEYRDDKLHIYFNPEKPDKPEGADVELADAIIRIAETAKFHNMDLEGALKIKLAYNKTRPYKHGRVNL